MTEDKNQEQQAQEQQAQEQQAQEGHASAEPAEVNQDASEEAQEPVGGEDKGVENPEPADPDAEQHQE